MSLQKIAKDYSFLFIVSGAVILLDQISKYFVRRNLSYGEIWPQGTWINQHARIVHITNPGAALGVFQAQGWLLSLAAVIAAGIILYYYPKLAQPEWGLKLALALIFGGALGNLIDRIFAGQVTDFIFIGGTIILNLADLAVICGVVIFSISLWRRERDKHGHRN